MYKQIEENGKYTFNNTYVCYFTAQAMNGIMLLGFRQVFWSSYPEIGVRSDDLVTHALLVLRGELNAAAAGPEADRGWSTERTPRGVNDDDLWYLLKIIR